MSFLITARNRRDPIWDFTVYETDGTTEISLAADDVVRVKIGANGETPTLDLSSVGDEVTFTAASGDCVLELSRDQVAAVGPGAWDVEVSVWDESDDKLRFAEYGVLFVHQSMLGDVGGEDSSSSGGSSESSSSGESSASSQSS